MHADALLDIQGATSNLKSSDLSQTPLWPAWHVSWLSGAPEEPRHLDLLLSPCSFCSWIEGIWRIFKWISATSTNKQSNWWFSCTCCFASQCQPCLLILLCLYDMLWTLPTCWSRQKVQDLPPNRLPKPGKSIMTWRTDSKAGNDILTNVNSDLCHPSGMGRHC